MIGFATLVIAVLGFAWPVFAEQVVGPDLRAEVTGNTLSGFNDSGVVFSEFHSPDGRIFGHNNGEPVIEGCWDIKDDAVCYYYSARRRGSATFCWRYDRAGAGGYRITSVDSRVTGVARHETGNPHNHTDRGQPWACEGLVSGLGGGQRTATR